MMRVVFVSLFLVFGCTLSGLQKVASSTSNAKTSALSESELKQFMELVARTSVSHWCDCEKVIKEYSEGTIVTYIMPKHLELVKSMRGLITNHSSKYSKVLIETIALEFCRAVSTTTPQNNPEFTLREMGQAKQKMAGYDPLSNGIFVLEL